MSQKTKVDQRDRDSFLEAIPGTKPLKLKHQKVALTPQQKDKRPPTPKQVMSESIPLTEEIEEPPVSSEATLAFSQPSISHKILRNLRKGQYNVEAVLDLHGMTVEKAKYALSQFLLQCLKNQIRVALIIHGKGRSSNMPILKNKLNSWLRTTQTVLAFCSANPSHGSRGAVYVLLAQNKIGNEENL